MALIVSQIVLVLVNRELSDGSVNWFHVSGRNHQNIQEQECIPVGCLPSPTVAVCRGSLPARGCLPAEGCLPARGCLPRVDVCLPGVSACRGGSAYHGVYTTPVDRQTPVKT